jgi:hypothetical protein
MSPTHLNRRMSGSGFGQDDALAPGSSHHRANGGCKPLIELQESKPVLGAE